mmetsp:Transcript_6995/g.28787  ORF Transcript_6995/g.28787 Transcript_6995/m.28787 type:complete len:241 (+) Transcript_6995:1787-2509(+)
MTSFRLNRVLMCPPGMSVRSARAQSSESVSKSSVWCFPTNRSPDALTCTTDPIEGAACFMSASRRRRAIRRVIFGKLKHSMVSARRASTSFRGSPFSFISATDASSDAPSLFSVDPFASASTALRSSAQPAGAAASVSHAMRLCSTPVRNDVAEDVATTGAAPTRFSPSSSPAAATIAATFATLPPRLTPVNTTRVSRPYVESAQAAMPALSATPAAICVMNALTDGNTCANCFSGFRAE